MEHSTYCGVKQSLRRNTNHMMAYVYDKLTCIRVNQRFKLDFISSITKQIEIN